MTLSNHTTISIQDEFNKHPLPEIDKTRISDDDFVSDIVIVSNLVLKFIAIAASVIPNKSFKKIEQGILLSHMVRLFKLYDSLLLLICENKFEIAILTARPIAETAIVLKYLLKNINEELSDKFIKCSLAYDKKLFDLIQKNTEDRNPLPIEERMLKSITSTFAKTKFKISDIEFQKDKKWHENLSVLAKKVGLEHYYETIYRVGSGAEHGTWHYLELYHLQEKDENYEPQLKYSSPSPKLLEATNYICLNATEDYIKNVNPDRVFLQLIQTVIQWHHDISIKHEEFLKIKTEQP
jgi:hypothetical protein